MADAPDGGRWYVGLDPAFDKAHRGRFIEIGQVTSFGIIIFHVIVFFLKFGGSDIFVQL